MRRVLNRYSVVIQGHLDSLRKEQREKALDIIGELDENPDSTKYPVEDLGSDKFRTASSERDVVVLWKKVQTGGQSFVKLVGISRTLARERFKTVLWEAFKDAVEFHPKKKE